ncbi:MAG TPA: protein kinase [Clostridiales bacterium]|nr:protein kinase [Clostridiales bacterium]
MQSDVLYYSDVYEHEKVGVNLLFDAVPKENYLLLVGTYATLPNSTREIDIILLCPKGIFTIEMKDWFGVIREPLTKNLRNITLLDDNNIVTSVRNPFQISEEQRKRVASYIKKNLDPQEDWKVFNKLNMNGGVKGVVFFTNKSLKFTIKDPDNILCITPDNLSYIWEEKYTSDVFDEEDLQKILAVYGYGTGRVISYFKQGDIVLNYKIINLILNRETYQMYKAYSDIIDQYYFLKAALINPGDIEEVQKLTKEIAVRDKKASARLKLEPYILFTTHAPAIFDNYIINVTDWVDHITLEEKIKQGLKVSEKRELITSLINIVSDMHSKGVYHRDLNPDSILITCTGDLKLINFDFAKLEGNPTVRDGLLGKFNEYRSPELIFKEISKIGYQTDYYSLGVIIYEILTGDTPVKYVRDLGISTTIDVGEQGNYFGGRQRLNECLRAMLSGDINKRVEGFAQIRNMFG